MAIYGYRAKKGLQDIVEDTVEAQSEKEAIEKISQLGYLPIRIKEITNAAQVKAVSSGDTQRIKSKEITIFSRQLASLLRSGVPVLAALTIIKEQTDNQRLKNIIYNVHNMVKEGSAFSFALSCYPKIFSPFYIAMIKAGEDGGTFAEVLLRISEYRGKEEEIISRLHMAMAYPILMAAVGIGTVVFMLTFVMPRLMVIFIDMAQALPLPTRILIATSRYLRQWWVWVILAIFIFAVRQQAKSKTASLPLSALRLRIPLFGKFILKAELARFSHTLEMLIKNGIPILKAINIAIPILENEVIKNQLKQSYKELEQGGSFGKSLRSSKVFPSFMSNLISVGEEAGRLDEALAEVASSYERDTDEAIKVMSSLLEPLMILVMGLIVGFIVVAMLLPIFQINFMAR
ncbi:MAG: type II secretion system F family protein [Candidatus Omnitrophica bacterium]|nr:type II secretion system F family protein [Candidatus Omnitrophota bacterium]